MNVLPPKFVLSKNNAGNEAVINLLDSPHTGIIGKARSGKTTVLKKLLHKIKDAFQDAEFVAGTTMPAELSPIISSRTRHPIFEPVRTAKSLADLHQESAQILSDMVTPVFNELHQRINVLKSTKFSNYVEYNNSLGVNQKGEKINELFLVIDGVDEFLSTLPAYIDVFLKVEGSPAQMLNFILRAGRSCGVFFIFSSSSYQSAMFPNYFRSQIGSMIMLDLTSEMATNLGLPDSLKKRKYNEFLLRTLGHLEEFQI